MKNQNATSETKPRKRDANILNYMTTALHNRLGALIDVDFYQHCHLLNVSEMIEPCSEDETGKNKENVQYTLIDLHIEKLPENRNFKFDACNWMVQYSNKQQTERIAWRTKFYNKRKTVSKNQSLVQRTETQIDIVLERFCNWFQSTFNEEHSHVSADYIKQLFSSGFEIHPAAQSIYIEPKQIFSIPHEVAEKYHVPELSTKNQKKKLMNLDDGSVPKPSQISQTNIAFGKCLPLSMKYPPPLLDDSSMKTNIPDELRTDEYLFKGIEGLRSTKFLIKHFDQPKMLEMKPLYFRNFKYEDDDNWVPLYKRLENKI